MRILTNVNLDGLVEALRGESGTFCKSVVAGGLNVLTFTCKDKTGNTVDIVLTSEIIKDIRDQVQPQIKQMPVGEIIETIEALGLSPKTVVDFFTKKVKFDITFKSEREK